ncbi:STAS/SEC14 domain-containing protein [Sulfurimonas sp.]
MIQVVDMPKNLIGFELSGTVTAKDYENVLIPALQKRVEKDEKIRVLYHVREDFDAYELGAMVDDAKTGFMFFSNWERIAVVSDVDWIINGVKIFSFIVPGELKTFANSEIDKARDWLLEDKRDYSHLKVTLEEPSKIAILEPLDALSADDFLAAKSKIDPFIEENGKLNGIIIYTKEFPGYDSFGGFIKHMEFIKEHHKHIKKLAFVTDSPVGELGEKIGSHFVSARVKNFQYKELEEAKRWILS